ncbi:MAG TPA: cyclase family protein, partial [Bacillota bacterium]|nr:cyclase family protein [Bacillota bacterium]
MMNKWIDLSVTLDNSFLVYPGDDPIGFTAVKAIERDEYNLQKMTTSMHVGTHMDAMKHVLGDGQSIDSADVNQFIGKARVLRPRVVNGVISTEDIANGLMGNQKILILDTRHSVYLNRKEYYNQPKFEKGVVDVLVEHEIQVIGFDLPSPEYVNGHFLNMHRDLMNHGIYIIENLTNLEQLDDVVDFIGLPLNVALFGNDSLP